MLLADAPSQQTGDLSFGNEGFQGRKIVAQIAAVAGKQPVCVDLRVRGDQEIGDSATFLRVRCTYAAKISPASSALSREEGTKRSSQSATNSSSCPALANVGRISASTHSQIISPLSPAALRSACSEESACAAELVRASSSTELSTPKAFGVNRGQHRGFVSGSDRQRGLWGDCLSRATS